MQSRHTVRLEGVRLMMFMKRISARGLWGGDDAHHARPGVFSNERVPQHLGQLAGSEWSVRLVPAQSSNALLQAGGGIDVRKSTTESKCVSHLKSHYFNYF